MKPQPIVTIVGRINVGKSSFFNRLTDGKRALVSKIGGTTRDYNIAPVSWRGKTFQLIDTGGIDIAILKNGIQQVLLAGKKLKQDVDEIDQAIITQTKLAIDKANLIIMIVDSQSGLMPQDKELALVLKKLKKPVLLVCNKIDNQRHIDRMAEFFQLGLGQPYPLSAANGSGVGDFLDVIVKKITWPRGRPSQKDSGRGIRVAIVGKPNAGKSSLVNQLLGEQRVIVSEIPHTTRDPQDTELTYRDKKIILIDTAGLRKKAKIDSQLEKLSAKRTLSVSQSADIVVFVTEVDKSLARQDEYLAGMIKDLGKGIIIVCNKWDLIEDKELHLDTKVINHYRFHLPYLSFAPIVFTSAKTGRSVEKVLDLILDVDAERRKEIPQKELDELKTQIVRQHHPAQAKGAKRPFVYSLTQVKTNPPLFAVTVGEEESLHFSYIRFIENQLRHHFGFNGVPVTITVRTLKR